MGSDFPGGAEQAAAIDRLNRLYWLSRSGVEFSFDVGAEMAPLRLAVPGWTTEVGDAAAEANMVVVRQIDEDADPTGLVDVALSEILARADEMAGPDFRRAVTRVPFRGLASLRPARALGALTLAGRRGEAPRQPWIDFLHAEERKHDSERMIRTIARRLGRLPTDELGKVVYPVTEWMIQISDRLYGDASDVLPELWPQIVLASVANASERPAKPNRSWAGEALNSPIGRLVDLLLKDPAKEDLGVGAGFPVDWIVRVDQLLGIPGDLGRYALVLMSHQVTWLFWVDPAWTLKALLPFADAPGNDGDAFWSGVLWAARMPRYDLFPHLKTGLLARAILKRQSSDHDNVIAGILLSAWGSEPAGGHVEPLITDIELREVLIQGDDDLRTQTLWHLERWSTEGNEHWRGRVVPFFHDVWPRQRALRSARLSERLAELIISSGNLMPDVTKMIVPRLVPIRGSGMHSFALQEIGEDHPARRYPAAMLDLLWAILAEDTRQWPYKVGSIIEILAENPETAADARLSELRRRQEQ